MNKYFFCTVLCLSLLCPGMAAAAKPIYGLSAVSAAIPEGSNDTTKNLQVALAVTEEMGQNDVPLTFFSQYHTALGTEGKVTHKVTIFRGSDRIWTNKRTTELEEMDFTSDSFNTFCDAYDEGLEPGDLVVFDFDLIGHSLSPDRGASLFVKVGPTVMWSLNTAVWDPWNLDCP